MQRLTLQEAKKARNGRIAAAAALWLFSVATASDWVPIVCTLPMTLLCGLRLAAIRERQFTPQDMLWLVAILFFVVRPNQAISENAFLLGPTVGLSYPFTSIAGAQFVAVLSLSVVAWFEIQADRAIDNRSPDYKGSFPAITDRRALLIALLCVVAFVAYVAFSGGLSNVASPRREKIREEMSFIRVAFLAILAVGTMLLASRGRKSVFRWIALAMCATMLLISVNPFNSPRFFNVASWFPIVMIAAGGNFTYAKVYSAVLLGVFVLMPITSMTSRGGSGALASLGDSAYARDMFLIKDIDVFDTLVHAVEIMRDAPLMWLDNVLAVAFFFVPRSLWPGKPIGGGLLVGQDLYLHAYAGTDNLSFFFAGDLYLDLGYLGVVLGSAVVGILWKKALTAKALTIGNANVVACVITGSIPILMRGPLGGRHRLLFLLDICRVLLPSHACSEDFK